MLEDCLRFPDAARSRPPKDWQRLGDGTCGGGKSDGGWGGAGAEERSSRTVQPGQTAGCPGGDFPSPPVAPWHGREGPCDAVSARAGPARHQRACPLPSSLA